MNDENLVTHTKTKTSFVMAIANESNVVHVRRIQLKFASSKCIRFTRIEYIESSLTDANNFREDPRRKTQKRKWQEKCHRDD